MFSTAWEFTKRHKGKIIAGSALIGSVVAYSLSSSRERTFENVHVHSELPNQARRHYIFDSTHRSCDQSITDLIPSITTQIEARFDCDSITLGLKNKELTTEQKMQQWNLLAKHTFSRIISVAYAFSILTLTLKAQISILAADTCAQFENRKKTNAWQQYLPSSITSVIGNASSSNNGFPEESPMEVGNRRIFLQCVQYFTLKGVPQLMESIAEAVAEELKGWQLSESRSKDEVRLFFDKIGTRIGTFGLLSKLVAPLEDDMNTNGMVIQLLTKLNQNLESEKSIITFNSLLDFYFSAALKSVQGESQPLARYIPSLSNAYPILTSTAYDSPLFNSLYSSDIHQFAVHVFNN